MRLFGRLIAVLLLFGLVVAAATARADGLPVLGIDVGGSGVSTSGGNTRYVTIPAGRDTLVARMRQAGGQVLRSTLLRGALTIPAVAYDGSADGLSVDGRTLVLIEPRTGFPRARTGLAVIDTRSLRQRRRISLAGDFSFDAISPRGTLLYLIQYVAPDDPNRYLVRAYDLQAGRLLPRPVVDPLEPDEQMRGRPLTRTASRDGRLAFTLYDGAGGTPFLHVLDTSRRSARCIDLDALARRDLSQARLALSPTGGRLSVTVAGKAMATIDTRRWRVLAVSVQ